jgi:undecaprenyl-diphosphatase
MLLGALQGATEFIPVSSSGHLVVVPWLLGWSDPGLAFQAIIHLGTAAAVAVYFRRDLLALASALLPGARRDGDARLLIRLIVATIPAAAIGYAFESHFEALFSRPPQAAVHLLVTGVLLVTAERLGRHAEGLSQPSVAGAIIIGLAQALAILPGISRSGATIAAGLMVGLKRSEAAHFSFLMAVPVIAGAGALELAQLASSNRLTISAPDLLLGLIAAALVGYGSIAWLLAYLRTRRLYPFALYCWLVGAVALAYAYLG